MDKELFLTSLSLRLSEGGMPKDEIDKRIKYFDSHLSKLSAADCEQKISELGGDGAVAEKLISDYRHATEGDKAEEKPAPEAEETAVVTPAEDGKKSSVSELLEQDDEDVKKSTNDRKQNTASTSRSTSRAPSKVQGEKAHNAHHTVKKGDNNKRFIIGMIILSPVILVCILVIAALLLSLFALVAASAAACAVALILIAALGTAFALVSIIYGITQLGTLAPAGLYEIGMGIVCGGITMLAGILLYNFIVRLVPFLFKKLVVLVKFVFKQLVRLYEYLKGVFAKI